ncbi:unnamed protein product [Pleuronectes platessa]|uniref:Uncharacterized protein n=1 Tax=Pleuronectes platessa TaxID=8262 RepID=A0A9N7Y877_PLEPL|nr:unnamed protein product [Pleuronectes platessa]
MDFILKARTGTALNKFSLTEQSTERISRFIAANGAAVVPAAEGDSCHHPPRLPAWWCGPSLSQEVLKLIQLIWLVPPGASATICLTQALQPPQGGFAPGLE